MGEFNVNKSDGSLEQTAGMPETYPAEQVMLSDGVTSVEDAVSGYHVIKSVTANGVKTYKELINELFSNVDFHSLADVIMTFSGTRLYIDNNNNTLIDFSGCTPGSTAMILTNILYHKSDTTKTAYRVCAIAQGSTTYTEYSSGVPSSGLVIALLTR